MHIPENYLSPQTCAVMGAIMVPVWYRAVKKVDVQIKLKKDTGTMLGISSSLSFLIMMFNLPVPGGTTARHRLRRAGLRFRDELYPGADNRLQRGV